MYDVRPNLVLAFHGCEKAVRDALLNHPNTIEKSEKPYDWLGNGVYFWENDHERAFEWAIEKQRKGEIQEPAIIGAVLYLGICCDFLDRTYIKLLSSFYDAWKANSEILGVAMPENRDAKGDKHKDKLLRERDCATIEFMHEKMFEQYQGEVSNHGFSRRKLFDTVRGVFTEGGEAFPGAGLAAKSHIQICVRNFDCIKGFFLPRSEGDFYDELRVQYGKKHAEGKM